MNYELVGRFKGMVVHSFAVFWDTFFFREGKSTFAPQKSGMLITNSRKVSKHPKHLIVHRLSF